MTSKILNGLKANPARSCPYRVPSWNVISIGFVYVIYVLIVPSFDAPGRWLAVVNNRDFITKRLSSLNDRLFNSYSPFTQPPQSSVPTDVIIPYQSLHFYFVSSGDEISSGWLDFYGNNPKLFFPSIHIHTIQHTPLITVVENFSTIYIFSSQPRRHNAFDRLILLYFYKYTFYDTRSHSCSEKWCFETFFYSTKNRSLLCIITVFCYRAFFFIISKANILPLIYLLPIRPRN